VLLYEQHTGHADAAVKPGGLEAFATRWANEVRAARGRAEPDAPTVDPGGAAPEDTIVGLLVGYRGQDPMQRASRVRSALALLDTLGAGQPAAHSAAGRRAHGPAGLGQSPASTATPRSKPQPDALRSAPAGNGRRPAGGGQTEPWPLANPPPSLPDLRASRAVGASTSDGSPAPRPAAPPRPEDEYLLGAPVTAIPGVGPTQEQRLNRLGLRTVRDVLYHFPREHHDYSKLHKIGQLGFGEVATILGLIWEVENVRSGGRGVVRTYARVSDETGAIRAVWFNQPYLLKQLPRGAYVVLTGVKQRIGNRVEFGVRSHELPEQGDLINTGRLVPVYPLTEGLTPKALRRITKWAVDRCAGFVPEHLPAATRTRARLISLPEAIAQIHYPDNERVLVEARRRLASMSCS
jgi:ATP-dependent DNA helicase RecG